LIDAGIPVALGTDFNPGTSPAPNAQLAMSFAIHRLRLSAAEALAALTINAAAALGMADSHGSLEPGKNADLVVWQPDSHALLPYWLGANLVRAVVKAGRVVFGGSA
jgi:imidazolonepropionase